jgi:hypothetical protein
MERPREYQRHPRFTKRLEATFSSGETAYKGILSDISENGVFIRTNRGFAPGSTVDIELVMPDNTISYLKGIVRRTTKTSMSLMKNGMGIELINKDETFSNFLKSYKVFQEPVTDTPASPAFLIIPCPICGIKNKVSTKKLALNPKCGKCGNSLPIPVP